MIYDKQILQILTDVGQQGISVRSLAMHVYNLNCSLFGSPDFADVYSYVRNYLSRNSKSRQSIVEHTGRWGYYRLNTQGNSYARQLLIEFGAAAQEEEQQTAEERPVAEDLSLDLFG
jgi:hypothetical protein